MDQIEQEWVDELCAKAQSDDYLRSALQVISELNDAIQSSRSINPLYQPMLNQMMTAFGTTKVQEIGWAASFNKPKS